MPQKQQELTLWADRSEFSKDLLNELTTAGYQVQRCFGQDPQPTVKADGSWFNGYSQIYWAFLAHRDQEQQYA